MGTGEDVTVQVVQYTGGPGYDNILGVESPTPVVVGHNNDWQDNAPPVDLGVIGFGQEIALYLQNPDGYKFLTGPGTRNPDGEIHDFVSLVPATAVHPFGVTGQSYYVDFEDLYGSGEGSGDFGDGRLLITGVQAQATPEPATLGVLAMGGVALLRRRKK